jgi:hypothetical protein
VSEAVWTQRWQTDKSGPKRCQRRRWAGCRRMPVPIGDDVVARHGLKELPARCGCCANPWMLPLALRHITDTDSQPLVTRFHHKRPGGTPPQSTDIPMTAANTPAATSRTSLRTALLRFCAATAVAVLFAGSVPVQPALADAATVVATIDGQAITEGDLALALKDLGEQFERVPEEKRRAAALQALIEIKLLSGKARADGLDKSPDFQQQINFLTDRVLHQAAIDASVAGVITEEDIRKRYDQEVAA